MQFALSEHGMRIEASKGTRALCPMCEGQVIAKCGEIVVHHWAHEAGFDCDDWFEPETEWHRAWKALFPAEAVEVPFADHRADILTPKGAVIELQNSAISPEEIRAREQCYKRMIWLVNAAPFLDRLFLLERYGQSNCFKVRWKHMRMTWQHAKKPVYLDLGAVRLPQLLGQKVLMVHEHPDIPLQRRIERRFHVPPDLKDFSDASILLINTIYPSGWGTVKALRRQDLFRILGIPADGRSSIPQAAFDNIKPRGC